MLSIAVTECENCLDLSQQHLQLRDRIFGVGRNGLTVLAQDEEFVPCATIRSRKTPRACLKTPWDPVFGEKVAWRDEGAYPPAVCDRGATKPGGLFRENPSGGGSFADSPRWLGRHSPLRGCSGLAALAAAKIPRRRTPRSFQTGSMRGACG